MVWTPLPLLPVSYKAPTPMLCCSHHAGTHLKAQGISASGPLHWLALLSGMLYWQIAAWLTYLTLCSKVTFMKPTLTPLQALPTLQSSDFSLLSPQYLPPSIIYLSCSPMKIQDLQGQGLCLFS